MKWLLRAYKWKFALMISYNLKIQIQSMPVEASYNEPQPSRRFIQQSQRERVCPRIQLYHSDHLANSEDSLQIQRLHYQSLVQSVSQDVSLVGNDVEVWELLVGESGLQDVQVSSNITSSSRCNLDGVSQSKINRQKKQQRLILLIGQSEENIVYAGNNIISYNSISQSQNDLQNVKLENLLLKRGLKQMATNQKVLKQQMEQKNKEIKKLKKIIQVYVLSKDNQRSLMQSY